MLKRLLLLTLSVGLVQGCNPFMIFRPNSEELVEKGWAKHPTDKKQPAPLYCYNTLGKVVCHSAPLKDQERLVSHYGPQP